LVEYSEFILYKIQSELNDFKFCNLLVGKHYLGGDQIRDEEMGRACGTYGEEKKYIQGFGGKS
jgi:hypothetical protein